MPEGDERDPSLLPEMDQNTLYEPPELVAFQVRGDMEDNELNELETMLAELTDFKTTFDDDEELSGIFAQQVMYYHHGLIYPDGCEWKDENVDMILCFLEIHAEFAIKQKDRFERLVQLGRVADTEREQVEKQIDIELGCIGQYLAAFSEEFGDDMEQMFDRVSERLEKSIALPAAATPISGRG